MAQYVVTAWYAYVFASMRGMTAAHAAQKTGINAGALSRWKNGDAPDPRTAVQFARGMGLNVLEALAAAELITIDEAHIHDVGVADPSVFTDEELIEEIGRRLSANRADANGGELGGSIDAAGGQRNSDESPEGIRTGPAGERGDVLDRTGNAAALSTSRPGSLVSSIDPEESEELTSSELLGKLVKTKNGRWGQNQVAALLGLQPTQWSKLLNGQIYPARLQTMQKIAIVFGWPVREQVDLIPVYWEWPEQARSGVTAGEPTDLRYAIKLARVVSEWAEANPRTMGSGEVTLHPDLKPISGPSVGRPKKVKPDATEEALEAVHKALQPEEPEGKAGKPETPPWRTAHQHVTKPLVLNKNPLSKR